MYLENPNSEGMASPWKFRSHKDLDCKRNVSDFILFIVEKINVRRDVLVGVPLDLSTN